MESCNDFLSQWWPYLVASGAVLVTVKLWMRRSNSKHGEKWPRDTVVLRQFPRGAWAPSASPYPIKLETYLRYAGIPYINELKGNMSPKQKIPWITYNDEDISDSEFVIDYLNNKFNVDLNQQLSDEQKSVATAFQRLVEDSQYWVLVTERWVYEPELSYVRGMLRNVLGAVMYALLGKLIFRSMRKQTWQQGMARHNREEVLHIADVNMNALSSFIGDKKFLLGDEPCQQDCSIFGSLAQMLWHSGENSPFRTMVTETYPNLQDYCLRMKERFWPDWDECITHGYTRPATK